MSETAIYYFGLLHLVAYLVIGASTCLTLGWSLFFDWIVRRFRLKADIFRAIKIVWDERQSTKGSKPR